MAPGAPPASVQAALGGRRHVGLVLAGARAQQRLPVRLSGRHGERRGHEEDVAFAERAVELGVAHVVAPRKPQAAEGAVDRERPRPGLERARLVVALGLVVEAEEIHLVVARYSTTAVVIHEAGAADAIAIFTRYGDGAGDNPDFLFFR